jgi:hypothetical protein
VGASDSDEVWVRVSGKSSVSDAACDSEEVRFSLCENVPDNVDVAESDALVSRVCVGIFVAVSSSEEAVRRTSVSVKVHDKLSLFVAERVLERL